MFPLLKTKADTISALSKMRWPNSPEPSCASSSLIIRPIRTRKLIRCHSFAIIERENRCNCVLRSLVMFLRFRLEKRQVIRLHQEYTMKRACSLASARNVLYRLYYYCGERRDMCHESTVLFNSIQFNSLTFLLSKIKNWLVP